MARLKPVTPGELLAKEFLEPMGISQYRLAREIGVPAQRIGAIVAGRRAITADTDPAPLPLLRLVQRTGCGHRRRTTPRWPQPGSRRSLRGSALAGRSCVTSMRHRASFAAWMTVLVVNGISAAHVQSPGNTPQARFQAQAYAVRIDVLVLDDGRPLRGLGRDDFRVTDNGVPQRVDVVSAESIAVDLVAAYDTSGSVRGDTLLGMRSALQKVIGQLRPQDRAALVSFSGSLM